MLAVVNEFLELNCQVIIQMRTFLKIVCTCPGGLGFDMALTLFIFVGPSECHISWALQLVSKFC